MDRLQAWDIALKHESQLDAIAKHYASKLDSRMGLTWLDLKSMGWEGVLRAVEAHDPERGSLSALIYVTTWRWLHNRVRDHIASLGGVKKGRGHNGYEEPFDLEKHDRGQDIYGTPEENGAISPVIEAALAQLTPIERTVIETSYLNTPSAVTTYDLAQMTGLSQPGAIKIRLRALKKLREILDEAV